MNATTNGPDRREVWTPEPRSKIGSAVLPRAVTSWLALAFAVVCCGLVYHYVDVLRTDRQSIAQAQDVLVAAQSVQLTEDEAEAAERAYVLNGETSSIMALQNALEVLPANAARLRRLIGADPAQAARAAQLEAVVARRSEQMLHAVEVRRNLGPRAAREYALRTDVRNTDRRMRDVLGAIIAAERGRVVEWEDKLRARERFLLGLALLSGVLIFGLRAVWHALRRRRVVAPTTEPGAAGVTATA